MFVRGLVVADDVDLLLARHGLVDQTQELQPLVMAMALLAEVVDLAGSSVERGEQCRRSVALVVVRHGGTASLFQGQSRRGAVQRLNLALLIYRQNQRVLRRIEIYADNVVQLGGELRIVDDLEALDAVRLQPMSAPDAPHAGLRAGLAGHRTRGPVSGVGGRRLRGPGNRLGNRLRRDPGRAAGARSILQQALDAELQKTSTPQAAMRVLTPSCAAICLF